MTLGSRVVLLAALYLGVCHAQMPTFSGLWKLNVSKSTWGRKQAPTSILVDIRHEGTSLKYSGSVVTALGDEREFAFAGSIDGREQPQVRPCGEGKVVLNRLGPNVVIALFRSNDGATVETNRMSLSRDGRRLTYTIQVQSPGGDIRWTEVYDRQ